MRVPYMFRFPLARRSCRSWKGIKSNWQGAKLAELIRKQLSPFGSERGAQIEIVGPNITLTSDIAESLGLALHELGTNAIKYGALSVSTGKIRIDWIVERRAGELPRLVLSWIEVDGPRVTPPSRKGFGHIVLGRNVAQATGGQVKTDFAPSGLKWSVSIPGSKFQIEN